MKKFCTLFLALAALFLSCTREPLAGTEETGEMVDVTISAAIPELMTKASIDSDGAGAKVNHWIMEVRDKHSNLYTRQEHDAGEGVLSHQFTVRLVKNHTYDFSFWADTKGAYVTDDLTEVSYADYGANLDSRDAFSCNVNHKSSGPENLNATLMRPFGQLNIIQLTLKTFMRPQANLSMLSLLPQTLS